MRLLYGAEALLPHCLALLLEGETFAVYALTLPVFWPGRQRILVGAYAAVIKNAFLVLLTSYIVLRLVWPRLLDMLLSGRHRGFRKVVL